MTASSAIRRLPRATLIYGLGDLAPKAIYFILLPWYLRYLEPAEFGLLALATAFTTLLGFFLQLNLNGSVFRFYLDEPDDAARGRLVGTLLLFQVGWNLAVVLVLQLAGPLLLSGFSGLVRYDRYLRLATWLALVTSLPVLPLAVLQMRHEAGLYRTLTFAGFMLSTGGIAAFVVGLRQGAYGFLWGQVLAGAVMLVGYASILPSRMRVTFAPATLRACLVFSLPLVPYALGGWVMDMSNRFLMERFLGVADVGRYNVGYQFALMLQAILNAFALAWLPVFYQLVKEEGGIERLGRFGKLYWCATLQLAVGVAVLAKDALTVLSGAEYVGAYAVVPILVATQALTCIWHLVVNPLLLVKKTTYLPVLMAAAAVVSVGLNVWLIPSLGLVGAALAVFGANLLLNAVTAVISLRRFPVAYDYGRMAGAVLAATVTFGLASGIALRSPAATILAKCFTLGVYPGLLLLLRVLRPMELHESWRFLRNHLPLAREVSA